MLEPLALRDRIVDFFSSTGALAGLGVLLTAGPTREAIDPVRFISNRSTGRMGFAVAAAAVEAGAQVTLVTGPVSLPTPPGVHRIDVESAAEMFAATLERAPGAAIFIATAAVSDYRPAHAATQKMKKHRETMSIELTRNPDILSSVAALEQSPFTVGFAAETDRVLEYAEDKRRRKNLDMIAANRVGVPGCGFESEQNALHVLWEGGRRELPLADKTALARELIALIGERYHAQHRG
jgi:phosphopantothenoylcysteine decarboxylase/phosphopantothenate--cysteine ligase